MRNKKFISFLIVLVITSSTLFAGFSGAVTGGFGLDLDDFDYSFINSADGHLSFDLYGNTKVKEGRGGIYAEAKAMLTLNLEKDFSTSNPNGDNISTINSFSTNFRIDYARLIGPGWEFGFIYVPGAPDYAKSPIDYTVNMDGTLSNSSVSRPFSNRAPGVYLKYHDYQVGVGLDGGKDGLHYTVYLETPRYLLNNCFMLRVGGYVDGDSRSDRLPSFGLSTKLGYIGNGFVATAAADADLTLLDGNASQMNIDAVASIYAGVIGFDAYYATKANESELNTQVLHLLSARLTSDFDTLGIPLRLTFTMKDVLARQAMELSMGYSILDDLLLEVSSGYTIASNGRTGEDFTQFNETVKRIGKWSAGASVLFMDDTLCEAEAGLELSQVVGEDLALEAKVDISTDAIVPGATFRLQWSSSDLLAEADNLGYMAVTCEVAF